MAEHWSIRKAIGVASVAAVLGFVAAVAWLLSKLPNHVCVMEDSSQPQKIHAIKVVVRPWLGRHQIYGIFMVPIEYRSGRKYTGTISVQDFTDEFIPDWHQIQRIDGVVVKPGYYLVQGYLPTRIALWFLFTGQFADMLTPCSWTLVFAKRIT